MKKFSAFTITTILLFSLSTGPVLAIAGSEPIKEPTKTSITPNLKRETINNLKLRARNILPRKIESLNLLNERISKIKRIKEEQKITLKNNIQTNITNLKRLKNTLDNDSDVNIGNALNSYQSYRLIVPKAHIIVTANGLLTASDKMNEVAEKLKSRINEEKEKGEDTSELEKILSDMQKNIEEAKAQAKDALDSVTPLEPTDFPANQPILQNARELLQSSKKYLLAARQKAHEIIVAIRKENINNLKSSITSIPTAAAPDTQSDE